MPALSNRLWWKRTTVYQIYPRSYKDSTGNGIGDIPGIISKLDYIKDLGVETIWFSPFFSSPQADHGYDVSDFRSIDTVYGTMADCDRLIQEIHDREMYVVFDLVLNHTSDLHPWFLESRSSRDNPKRDWYIWRDGKKPNGKKPPTNWKSIPGGSGWHYDAVTDQWYWAQFLEFQPDLNYRNPEVRDEMFNTIRFWLDKGVDGFRLDIINTVFEDPLFRDNPFSWKYFPGEAFEQSFFQNRRYTMNHPDTFQFVQDLRSILDEYTDPERFLVGEISATLDVLRRYCGEETDKTRTNGLHMTFLFQTLNSKLESKAFHDLITNFEEYFPEPFIPTWVFSNHDQMRRITRLGNDIDKAKLNATFQLTVRGVPFIYYGEEIGMQNHRLPLKTAEDPIAQKYKRIPQILVNLLTRSGSFSLNRDDCRTPMQWAPSSNAGFCVDDISPWLPISSGSEELNVSSEDSDPNSLLNCYRSLFKIRRETPALHSGTMSLLPSSLFGDVLSYQRIFGEQIIHVLLNFSQKPTQITEIGKNSKLLFSTIAGEDPMTETAIHLQPYQGVVLEVSRDILIT